MLNRKVKDVVILGSVVLILFIGTITMGNIIESKNSVLIYQSISTDY